MNKMILVIFLLAMGASINANAAEPDSFASFETGEARLTCGLSCSFSYGSSRKKLKSLHDNGLWKDLAQETLSIGYENDQSYFYLGRAAEGMGQISASRIYYSLALSEKRKCNSWVNVCDGLVFPSEINIRWNIIEENEKKEVATKLAENINPLAECMEKVKSKSELRILDGKMELIASADPSFEKLADSNYPTDNEKVAISLWMSERQKCLEANDEWRRSHYSAADIAHWDDDNEKLTSSALDLYAKKISYGDFAKAIKLMHKEDRAFAANKIQQQQQQVTQQLNQQQDAAQQKNMDIGSCTLVAQRAANNQQELVNEQNAKGCNASNAKCGALGLVQGLEISSARNQAYNACMSAKGW